MAADDPVVDHTVAALTALFASYNSTNWQLAISLSEAADPAAADKAVTDLAGAPTLTGRNRVATLARIVRVGYDQQPTIRRPVVALAAAQGDQVFVSARRLYQHCAAATLFAGTAEGELSNALAAARFAARPSVWATEGDWANLLVELAATLGITDAVTAVEGLQSKACYRQLSLL